MSCQRGDGENQKRNDVISYVISSPPVASPSTDSLASSWCLSLAMTALHTVVVCMVCCRYVYLFEKITGQPFQVPDVAEPVNDRMIRNLKQAGLL